MYCFVGDRLLDLFWALMEFDALVRAGLADVAGFKAHDLPNALRVAHIDAGIAIFAGHLAVR